MDRLVDTDFKPGEAASFRVSAQTPSALGPKSSARLFQPVMRMAQNFHPYRMTTEHVQPTRTIKTATPPRSASPAPLTFIQQQPNDLPLDRRPFKRLKLTPATSKHKFRNKKAIFSVHRPLKKSDEVHKDAWTHILSFCPPRFLLQAKTVNTLFHDILSQQTIWKESRMHHLRPKPPPCPDGIGEQQYTDLLVGRGCQRASCRRENTVSICWALLVRLCPECLQSLTTRFLDLPEARQYALPNGRLLCDALPMLLFSVSHRSGPREVRTSDDGELSYTDSARSSAMRFHISAYTSLESEYLEQRERNPSDDDLNAWFDAKSRTTLKLMRQRCEINTWTISSQSSDAAALRTDRELFFERKALALQPPMQRETLDCFTAFKKALASSNAPTERAWETLKAKILPFRTEAELLQQALKRPLHDLTDEETTWMKIAAHRSGQTRTPPAYAPEQEFVLNIARAEYRRCIQNEVADSDLVLLTLKHVYDQYQRINPKPTGLNFDGRTGPYQLTLDDARTIVDTVIRKNVKESSQREVKVFARFRCPACVMEKERGRVFKFEACFEHLLNSHGKTVGEGPEFWRYALAERPQRNVYWLKQLPFPWYTIPWPRCLPILPEHQDPSLLEMWRPEMDRPYIQETTHKMSAFEGRHVNSEIDEPDFLQLFRRASKALLGLRLSGRVMTRIAMQFAIDASEVRNYQLPTLTEFIDSIPFIQAANPAMDCRFRCGICMRKADEKASNRHVKHNIPAEALQSHWKKRHQPDPTDSPSRRRKPLEDEDPPRHWTLDFMHLPSDSEVLEEMLQSDAALAKEKEALQAPVGDDLKSQTNSRRRKPRAKATVILSTKPALEVFDELFIRDQQ